MKRLQSYKETALRFSRVKELRLLKMIGGLRCSYLSTSWYNFCVSGTATHVFESLDCLIVVTDIAIMFGLLMLSYGYGNKVPPNRDPLARQSIIHTGHRKVTMCMLMRATGPLKTWRD